MTQLLGEIQVKLSVKHETETHRNEGSSINHGAGRTFFPFIEIVNAAFIVDKTLWCEGTPTHLDQEGTVHCHSASPQLPRGDFENS